MEAVWQISLAEINRRKSKKRTKRLNETFKPVDFEKGSLTQARCIASVVGYREEPNLFTKAMNSYKDCPGLEILLVGIDGNDRQDQIMADIVRKIYPATISINLDERLADKVVQRAKDFVIRELQDRKQPLPSLPAGEWNWDDIDTDLRQRAQSHAMDQACNEMAEILEAHNILYSSPSSFQSICITQPHINKKGIMFTNLVVATVLGRINHIQYLWTSDSDTWVTPDTLPLTIGCMEFDPTIGGSCSTLGIHNGDDTFISSLGSAIYWAELAITRGQTGAIDAVDCQPGPCAAFRLPALSPNLFSWYTQTSMGIKTVVNEDRHLTTKLLLDGWKVTFNTEAIAYTDTPTTLLRWLLQQIRWARATQIETFQYPLIYAIHGPIFFLTSLNRVYGPLAVMIFTIRYALTGQVVRAYSVYDVLLRVVLCVGYNWLAYRRRMGCSLGFLALSQVFYQMPLPGIIVYASLTALESGWGTSMRGVMATSTTTTTTSISSSMEAKAEVEAEAVVTDSTKKVWGKGWQNLGSVCAVCGWLALVAMALVRWVMTGYLGVGVGVGAGSDSVLLWVWMGMGASVVSGSMAYALLRSDAKG